MIQYGVSVSSLLSVSPVWCDIVLRSSEPSSVQSSSGQVSSLSPSFPPSTYLVCSTILIPHRNYLDRKFWSSTFILLSLSIGVMLVLRWLQSQLQGYHPIVLVLVQTFTQPVHVSDTVQYIPACAGAVNTLALSVAGADAVLVDSDHSYNDTGDCAVLTGNVACSS